MVQFRTDSVEEEATVDEAIVAPDIDLNVLPERSVGVNASDRITEFFRGTIQKGKGDEAAEKVAQEYRELLANSSIRPDVVDKIRVDVISKNPYALNMTCIAITYTDTSPRDNITISCTHTQMLEITSNGITPGETALINDGRTEKYTYERVPGDVYTPALIDIISNKVRSLTGADKWHSANCSILSKVADITDIDFLKKSLDHANQAAWMTYAHACGQSFLPFNPQLLDESSTLTINVDFNPTPLKTLDGMPVRTDILMDIKHINQNNESKDPFIGNSTADIVRCGGFIDLLYVEPEQGDDYYNHRDNTDGKRYQARFNITKLESLQDATSPGLLMYILGNSVILEQRMRWATTFLPMANPGKLNLRDIGAIGYEVPTEVDGKLEYRRIDTYADFTTEDLYSLLKYAVRPGLIYSLHCEERGFDAATHEIFLEAAYGNKHAEQQLIEQADLMFDGRFSEHYQGTGIGTVEPTRQQLGYYPLDNRVHDIRNFDYLGFLNVFGGQDHDIVVGFDSTNLAGENSSVDMQAIATAKREEYYRKISPGHMVITGYARIVNFSDDFIGALATAMIESGYAPTANNVHTGYTDHRRREFTQIRDMVHDNPRLGNGMIRESRAHVVGGMRRTGNSAYGYYR